MIKVIYHRNLYSVSVEGHAFSGMEGHDLICASASILMHTLANNVEKMTKERVCRRKHIRLSKGDALISCSPVNRYKAVVRLVFDTLCSGLEILAENYPENVSYEIRG